MLSTRLFELESPEQRSLEYCRRRNGDSSRYVVKRHEQVYVADVAAM